jgi:hypothetical protein
VDVVLESAYGRRSVPDVAPGAHAFRQFATRGAAAPAGTATVRVTGTVDGRDVTTVRTAAYPATTCGG